MIVPVMPISNLVLTQQIYSEETNGAHAHYREPLPLMHVEAVPWKQAFMSWTRRFSNVVPKPIRGSSS